LTIRLVPSGRFVGERNASLLRGERTFESLAARGRTIAFLKAGHPDRPGAGYPYGDLAMTRYD
jgi:hypothetical protein